MGSTRLPGKILMKAGGRTLLENVIMRVGQAEKVNNVVIATTVNKEDDKTEKLCRKIGINCFRGSENDVLSRYFECAKKYPEYKNIIRVTGDCPLIDPKIIDEVVSLFEKNNFDYASNVQKETYPDGMDVEIFKKTILAKADKEAVMASEREHVTLYIRNSSKFKKGNLENVHDFSHFRLTVDNPEDYEVIKFLIENSDPEDGYLKYVSLLTKNPEIMAKNSKIVKNAGLIKSLKEDKVVKKYA
jgi:spore coat polysaccharide biosynthesis protein SpsF (cytidylyltransferase family)